MAVNLEIGYFTKRNGASIAYGTAVQLAARICDRAEPGQVLVSRVVADLCAGKRLAFRHDSDATLKGFAEPVALYEVLK